MGHQIWPRATILASSDQELRHLLAVVEVQEGARPHILEIQHAGELF